MRIIGVTGGTGGGKTTVSKIMKSLGAQICDADVVARAVVEPGSLALSEIADEWDVVRDGVLDRKALAKIVFNDEVQLHKLNAIVHKYVIEEIKSQLSECKAEIFVIDAIALFESGLSNMCHTTVAVIADQSVRLERIMARDSLTEEEALLRINAQKNDDFYIKNADVVIYNNGSDVEEEIGRIIKGS